MTLRQLEYFIAVAEQLNFTKAAEKMYVSQTTITQQIKALETELRTTLFFRTSHHVSITPAGRAFLAEARAILERTAIAVERATLASTGIWGNLEIGYIKGYERSGLSLWLHDFHEKFPNVSISCHRGNPEELQQELLERKYDLAFTLDFQGPHGDASGSHRLLKEKIQTCPLFVAMHPSHPLAGHRRLEICQLTGQDMLLMGSGLPEKQLWGELSGAFSPQSAKVCGDVESILLMVAADMGIAVLPDYVAKDLLEAKELRFVPLTGDHSSIDLVAAWNEDTANEALSCFLDLIADAF